MTEVRAGVLFQGGSAVLEFWFTFSNSPITDFNPVADAGPVAVPECASTFSLLGLAVVGLAATR